MTTRAVAPALLLVAFVACAVPDAATNARSAPEGTWRGDVSYPGLPAIGVRFVLDEAEPRMIAAVNMGFDGGPLERFRIDDRGASFRWSLNDDVYDCELRSHDDGTLLGPCTSPDEPTIGVRMVPPGVDAPTGLTRTLLEMSSVRWVRVDSGSIRVRVAAENAGRVDRDAVRADIERARADNAQLFGDEAAAIPLDVFFVGDRDVMRRVVGRAAGGWTDPLAGTVALVGFGEHSVALRHELTHAISFNAWGPPLEGAGWLREGLATWVAGECAGYSLHDLARDLRERGELLPLRALIDDFARQDDIVAYLQSGSVVGYLLETHGTDGFRRVWLGGESALRRMDGSVAELEQGWLRFLDARPAAGVDRDAISEQGCG